ncbi:MAG: argininosuccinate lyase [bacterium]|nr:argininosuccinate lyase [bacterium]
MDITRLWGDAFDKQPAQETIEFMAGRDVTGLAPADENLIEVDLLGNKAHCLMLQQQGIISSDEARLILEALAEIENLYRAGEFKLDPAKEDVHSNIEAFLVKRCGMEAGGKIHTGRSRNDQVALDMRLYLRSEVIKLSASLTGLIKGLLTRAGEHLNTIMPGYTHHQHAMLTTFGHLLLSFAEGMQRDLERLRDWYNLFNKNPLGSAAAYSTTFQLDRELTSRLLGFDSPHLTSLDPITNRWEPEASLAAAISLMMNHFSAIAQSFILFSTSEFNFIKLSDAYCSGSSIMPQKKNPCSLEVIKARAAIAQGILISLLSIGQSNLFGYNRDSQWTKYLVMDLIRETGACPVILKGVIDSLEVNKKRMLEESGRGFITATALAEALVRHHGLSFRQAKSLISKAVKYSKGEDKVSFSALKQAISEENLSLSATGDQVEDYQDPERIISRKRCSGGPAPAIVQRGIEEIEAGLISNQNWWDEKLKQIEAGQKEMARLEAALSKNK